MDAIIIVIAVLLALAVGFGIAYWLLGKVLRERNERMIAEARLEAERVRTENIEKAEAHFQRLKTEFEAKSQIREEKIVTAEKDLKQRENNLRNQQTELQKKRKEQDAQKASLTAKMEHYEGLCKEAEELRSQHISRIEEIAGMSAATAKEQLIQQMTDVAKSEAMSYAAEIVEEAKLNANKEAKRIIVQSVQRLATETAIENAVSVFHIDSDEVKGKIIGR